MNCYCQAGQKMFDEHIGFGDYWNRCHVCGRFVTYSDIETGKAVHRMITPDSDFSYESFETLCAEHTPNAQISGGTPSAATSGWQNN